MPNETFATDLPKSRLRTKAAKRVCYLLIGLGTVVAAVAGVIASANLRFQQTVRREIDTMFAQRTSAQPGVITEAAITHLPVPVQRWLRSSGVVGKERVTTVRLRQRGQMRSSADQPWMPIEAEQYYTTTPPAFVWSATAHMNPLVWARVRDKNIGGAGNITVKALGLVTIEDKQGPQLDHDTLLRYLNEIMWFPAGALSDYISWQPIDDASARAIMTYQGLTGSAVFHFDEQGRITTMVAERYAGVDGGLVTWETPITAYGEFNGVLVPTKGEALYKLETGDFTYGQIEILDIEYNRPARYDQD